MKIELKKIKVFKELSDETKAFVAGIYVNDKKIGYAKNEGRGGSIFYNAYSFDDNKTLDEVDDYLKTQPDIIYPKDKFSDELAIECNLENWIDKKINDFVQDKFLSKREKDTLKGIVYGNDFYYIIIKWEKYTIEQLLESPTGKELIQKEIDKLKKTGAQIYNKNLTGINFY